MNKLTRGSCERTNRKNQGAILCDCCDKWHHLKCCGLSKSTFNKLGNSTDGWAGFICGLPQLTESFFATTANASDAFEDQQAEAVYVNAENKELPDMIQTRTKGAQQILIMHLNVNSLPNKTEDVATLVKESRAQVVFLTETKNRCLISKQPLHDRRIHYLPQ